MAVRQYTSVGSSAAAPNDIEVRNPITGEVIGSVPTFSAEQVRAAVERARAAQPTWNALGVKGRGRLIRRWADAMWAAQAEFIALLRSETGKTEPNAYNEVAVIDNTVGYYYGFAPRILRPQSRKTFLPFVYKATVYHEPYGVVGAITPWNYPYLNLLIDVIPALFAGNAVVIKPSEVTPLTAQYAIDRMQEAGIPRDVVQIVTGKGDTGRALIEAADYITFTGSTAVGKQIAVRCAERMIPCSLELGGKDAMIVLNDADLEQAALSAVRGGLENAGQVCVGVERIYVEAGVYDAFVEKLRGYLTQMICCSDDGYGVHMGSMTNPREVERVEAHLEDAVQRGAQVLAGGSRLTDKGPLFYAPTLLTGVDHTMRVMTEETFGPLLPVMKVRDAEEALQLANDSVYGLSGSVFSRDERHAVAIARRMQAGDVSVNGTQLFFLASAANMGGFKESGIGRRGGPEGLLRYVQTRSIVADRLPIKNREFILANKRTRLAFTILRRLRRIIPTI
ncbi:MAG: aldehyde dehydrogenase family protein [Anaerolineae bacterium]|nr:aldehyde dehydrogenase family protein [Anaerolineae bacterium]NUQ07066.1 aldehyde dehydrogenase family protein [Anaerolineae bacterium]